MLVEDTVTKIIKARESFSDTIARAGLTRTEVARQADVSTRTLDALSRPDIYKRSGAARTSTAWRIARGFAALTHQSVDDAFNALFVEVDDEEAE
jgi:DNA-binding XRE family transcriptional regulator